MPTQQNNYQLLIHKLDQFIRKFYLNQLLRGALYFIAFIVALYLLVSALEYYFYFSSPVRKTLFFSFILAMGVSAYKWIGIPLLHYFKLGKIISHEKASKVIGQHFSNVEDRLLNILQLKKQSESMEDRNLIEASIHQKIDSIKLVPFSTAIRYSNNRKYLKYALPPALILIFMIFGAPNILRESNNRLINNNREFIKEAPFIFEVENESMSVLQYEDFVLKVSLTGEYKPEHIVVETPDFSYRLIEKSQNVYEHRFRKVQDDIPFKLTANGYYSEEYGIDVLPKPMITGFETKLDYPPYTRIKAELKNNIGDLVVPAGTKITWKFNSKNTDLINIRFADSLKTAQRNGKDNFNLSGVFLNNQDYKIFVSSDEVGIADSIHYAISVIPDLFPSISVEEYYDSINSKVLYFLGNASDDYGMYRVEFKYNLEPGMEGADKIQKTFPVKSAIKGKDTRFNYAWDINELNLKPGDKLQYYFQVWDNDGVNGSKLSKTPLMTYEMPTVEVYEEITKQTNEEIKSELEESMKKAHELKEEIRDLQEDLLQKKELSWEDKKNIEDLLEKQKDLHKSIEDLKNKFNKNIKQQSEYKKQDERITEKQEKLQELFDEMLTEEMKDLMKEIEELMDKLEKDDALEELEEYEMSNEQLEKELDRMLELFKQLEFEAKLDETIEDLEKLAKEENELSEESKKEESESEELSEKQEDINKKFDDIKKDLEELEKMNKELEQPNQMEDTESQEESIQKDMDQSQESLKQDQKQKASEKQKSASDKMKEMADQMSSMMNSMQMEQMSIDMDAVRRLLDNLIKLSFDQEDLMVNITNANVNTPRYKELVQEQHAIKEDIKMVEDSLLALSKRVFQISSFVNKEVTAVKHNMEKSIELLADRKKPDATSKQQYVMTGLNNLALMLDEIMQEMQQQMASKMSGTRMCQKPSSGKSMKEVKDMQKKLNDQMEGMKEQMKKGKGKKNGKMSKELAEMAAKQAAIRKALKEISEQYNKDGQNKLGDLEQLGKDMEKTEEDIVNKRLTEEMMKRQEEIMIRLLEAEKAEREREQSPERESKTADDVSKKVPPEIEEYLKARDAEIDLYRTVPPALKPFYKNLVENYFRSLSINN